MGSSRETCESVLPSCHNRIPQTGGLDSRNVLTALSRSWKAEMELSAGWCLLRPRSRVCTAASSLCPHRLFPLQACRPGTSLRVLIRSSYKAPGHIGYRAHPNGLVLIYLFKGLIPKHSHILRYWRLRARVGILGQQNSAHVDSMLKEGDAWDIGRRRNMVVRQGGPWVEDRCHHLLSARLIHLVFVL